MTLAFFHKGQVASLSIGSSSKTSSRGLLTQDHVKDADLELILKNKDQNNEMANKPKSKRKYSYVGLGCRGMFHQIFFSKLENLCDQCYEMYKIPEIHHLCRYLNYLILQCLKYKEALKKFFFFGRSDCFQSDYFQSCVSALMLKEKQEVYSEMISILG